jgi:hypothetical protein
MQGPRRLTTPRAVVDYSMRYHSGIYLRSLVRTADTRNQGLPNAQDLESGLLYAPAALTQVKEVPVRRDWARR